ncbi:MAG: hypothetical protein ACP5IL_03510 [Syntrophobacteraceae bacterium]
MIAKTLGKSFTHLIGLVLMLASIAGCASLKTGPSSAAPPPAPGVEAKLAQADKALRGVRLQIAHFYCELNSVRGKIDQLRRTAYWGGFEAMLVKYPCLSDPGKESEMTPKIKARLSLWSQESGTPWEEVMRKYSQLADRCAILDMKRVAARQMLISVQARYMAVVMMETQAGRAKKARQIFSLVNSLDKPGTDLDAIQLDRIGLY